MCDWPLHWGISELVAALDIDGECMQPWIW
jgi:hypothetical protein